MGWQHALLTKTACLDADPHAGTVPQAAVILLRRDAQPPCLHVLCCAACTCCMPVCRQSSNRCHSRLQQAPAPPCSPPVWESCLNRTLAVPTNALDVDAVWSAPLATVRGGLRRAGGRSMPCGLTPSMHRACAAELLHCSAEAHARLQLHDHWVL